MNQHPAYYSQAVPGLSATSCPAYQALRQNSSLKPNGGGWVSDAENCSDEVLLFDEDLAVLRENLSFDLLE